MVDDAIASDAWRSSKCEESGHSASGLGTSRCSLNAPWLAEKASYGRSAPKLRERIEAPIDPSEIFVDLANDSLNGSLHQFQARPVRSFHFVEQASPPGLVALVGPRIDGSRRSLGCGTARREPPRTIRRRWERSLGHRQGRVRHRPP